MLNYLIAPLTFMATGLILLLIPLTKVNAVESSQNLLPEVDQYTQLDATPITPVNELSDVQPTDWAFQALQSLVERYGCLAGYPNGTFQGNRAMTRFEFAAAFNACLDKINQSLNAETANAATQEDLMRVQRLQEQFATELATVRGRVDAVEIVTQKLEQQQFSTTTKLEGQIIVAAADAFGDASRSGNGDDSNLTFSSRARINFITSFTGKDRLLLRMQASNVVNPIASGNEARLSFQSGSDTNNNVLISKLEYRFLVGEKIQVFVGTGFNTYFDDADVINPLQSDAYGTVSRFGRYSTLYRLGGDTGVGVTFTPNKNFTAQFFYLAGNANNPSRGLFDSKYGALGQLIWYPNSEDKATKIAFTYVNAYSENGLGHNTGSLASNLNDRKVSSNSYGIEANFKIRDGFQLGGWVGYINARALTGDVKGDADIWNWAVTLAFPDLGKQGNLGGIIVGMQPKLTGSSAQLSGLPRHDPDTGFHIEAFYRYQINDRISITPGVIWLTAPNHNEQNGDIFLGVIRTTFRI
ncbi:hypothetical protein CLI64_19470 [Nostoc sp. CENA543]|uniref:iron uptake porin n=1 Tax=Nostoc sp. CENA543 TaxID=1869241 RepID=UPI000CA187D1|nr:iron uptake porin [Nostoc sp. CENA543]AUT02396.1 hypothetical protein CLI64_19470 [Nostoc sp. CENA543]